METAHKIDTIVFDKTGTITRGKPTVIDKRLFVKNSQMTMDRMLAIAGKNDEYVLRKISLMIGFIF